MEEMVRHEEVYHEMGSGMSRPIIDPEFAALIAPLTSDELALLEESIVRDGCRDPLVVWAGENILLDGHHRLAICEKHGVPYSTVEVELPNRDAALVWVARNQLGRRNLAPYQKAELAMVIEKHLPRRTGNQYTASAPVSNETEAADKPSAVAPQIVGLSRPTYERAKTIAGVADDETKAKLRAGETTINAEYERIRRAEREAQREAKRQENAAKVAEASDPLSSGARFTTIVIDPPWDWGDEGDVDQMGRARPTYATMPAQEIAALPIADLADDDAHIYLWITNRSLPKGFPLLEHWGFRYVTCVTWVKPSFGMGNYFRGQTEHVLFGVRGHLQLKRKDAPTVFFADRGPGGHSSKPPAFLEFVESCSPGPYLEMFSRSQREGWSAWGEPA